MRNPNKGHVDIMGKPINVGDYIVYSAVDGRSGVLRAGRVVELKVRESGWACRKTPTVLAKAAQENFGEGPRPMSKAVTLGFMERILVVPKEALSPEYIKALE